MSNALKLIAASNRGLPDFPPYTDPSTADTQFSENLQLAAGVINGLTFDGTNMISTEGSASTVSNIVRIHSGVATGIGSTFAGPESGNSILRVTMIDANMGSIKGGASGSQTFRIHDGVSSSILSSFSIDIAATLGTGTIQDICYNGRDLVIAWAASPDDFLVVMSAVTGTVKSFRNVELDVSGSVQTRGLAWVGTQYVSNTAATTGTMTIYDQNDGSIIGVDSSFDATGSSSNYLTFGGTNLYSHASPDFFIHPGVALYTGP